MKTIGVLGGMGPQATMYFEQRVHAVSQRLLPIRAGMGYPPMVVYYHRAPPVVVDDQMKPLIPLQPNPQLLAAAKMLGPLADFFVITSNAPHLIRAELEEALGKPILSMIELVLGEVQRRAPSKVGVLGLGEPHVHLVPLSNAGIATEHLSGDLVELRDRLDLAIFALMQGSETDESRAVAQEAVDVLRGKGADPVILGCTEIPLLLGEAAYAPDLISSLDLLAEAAVRHAAE
jgi:aspartate racemase